MQIIPAIDIIDGQCVRLLKGDYNQQTTYAKTPVEMAQYFESCGTDKIHLVDLDGAKQKRLVNLEVIKEVCAATSLPVEIGGGIRSAQDIQLLFYLGVQDVVIGSLALQQPELLQEFLEAFGPERIIVGIDALDGIPKISGWQENGTITVDQLIKQMRDMGVQRINYTDISRDGTLSSPNFSQYEQLVNSYPDLQFIASGGVSSKSDVDQLRAIPVAGVIIGKAIYENTLNLSEIC